MKNKPIMDIKRDFERIFDEIKRRANGKHCNYNITGVEIKLRRCAKELTLAELAEDICSVSYLCKVEQSQIKPNLLSLHDICAKLDIDSDTLDVLMSLEKVLNEMVNAYFEKDANKIKKIYLSGKSLENYRYKIVELIYHIFNHEYVDAYEITKALNTVISSLDDMDLLVYTVFFNILNFNLIPSSDIYEELKILSKIYSVNDNLNYLIDTLKIKCLFIMNSPLIVKRIDELSNEYLRIARFDLIEELRYILAMYFLYNGETEGFMLTKDLICAKGMVRSLELYKKVFNDEKIYSKDLSNVSESAYILGLSKIDNDKALELLNQRIDYIDEVEFSNVIVEYQGLKTIDEKYNYILFVAMPSFKASQNNIVGKYFINELLKITKITYKYKLFYQFYLEINS